MKGKQRLVLEQGPEIEQIAKKINISHKEKKGISAECDSKFKQLDGEKKHMKEKDKHKKKQSADTSKKVEEEQKKNKEEPCEVREFVTQCRPQGLSKLVEQLNAQQIEAVKCNGFGGLLHLRITSLPTTLLRWLVKNFNGTSQMLRIDHNKSFVVTADDVHDVFLLPRNHGSDVLKLGCNEPSDLMIKLKEDFDLDSKSPLISLKDLIITRLTDGINDFKRLFILYSLSSFLTPTSNRLVDLSTLKSLSDVEQISKYDWCTHIFKKICNAVQKYNSNPHLKYVSGCVSLLQILYFHKLKMAWHC